MSSNPFGTLPNDPIAKLPEDRLERAMPRAAVTTRLHRSFGRNSVRGTINQVTNIGDAARICVIILRNQPQLERAN